MTTINFNGKNYTLTTDAVMTDRLLPYPKNYHEVADGEEYDFEMTAKAVDDEGNEYLVSWIFTDVKGEEMELDCLDYDNVDDITAL